MKERMPLLYFIFAALLILGMAYITFRVICRRDYRNKGKLGWFASCMEFVVFALHANSAYMFLPASWPELPKLPDKKLQVFVGLGLAAIGFLLLVYAMSYLGLKKAFGQKVDGLNQTGVYRLTRNPQIVFYTILLVGFVMIWLSWHSIVWLILYFIIAHMMVITEEEHLRDVYAESYEQYCRQVPRYLFIRKD
jgi:protein-S-isoprenylcysteine O-methyltransferase Ste14